MKKMSEIIRIRKFKTEKNKAIIESLEGENFLIWFEDDTCKEVYFKQDLIPYLKNDHKKRIKYIFDMQDRIIVERDIEIKEVL